MCFDVSLWVKVGVPGKTHMMCVQHLFWVPSDEKKK